MSESLSQSVFSSPGMESQIAIVGMNGRFPNSPTLEQWWRNLCEGVELVSFFSDDQLISAGSEAKTLDDPTYVKAAAIVGGDEIKRFDASFFGFSPREAELMDPQHRVFLECAWHALENAGYSPNTLEGRVGVYAGQTVSSYWLQNVLLNPDIVDAKRKQEAGAGSAHDFLATRVSYKLNLKGPAITVQTACSTSLVAVHLACQSLLSGECDMALAGGVSLAVPQAAGYWYQEGGILSPDGHCRVFDAKAQGTVPGSGAGIVVLRRLKDALEGGDNVIAIIRGSAINNDGGLKVSFTAPGIDGQFEAISEALAIAGVRPESITYVEAHGTGTALGDPAEIAALTKAFGPNSKIKQWCAIGSVKSNMGHLDVAAGVAPVALDLLGAHVVGRAQALAQMAPGEAAGARQHGRAKVGHLEPAVRGDQDVLRLEVAMDDVVCVRVVERVGHGHELLRRPAAASLGPSGGADSRPRRTARSGQLGECVERNLGRGGRKILRAPFLTGQPYEVA